MKSNTSLIKEIKKNVEGRSKSCCYELPWEYCEREKNASSYPNVFPRKEGVLLMSRAPLV